MGRRLRQERTSAFRRFSENEAQAAELFFQDLMGEAYPRYPSSDSVSRAASKRRIESFRDDSLEQTDFLETPQPSWDAEQYDEAEGLPEDDEEAWLEFDAEFVEPDASPNGANAAFAPLLTGTGHWPIITSDPQGRTVSYRTAAGAWMGRQGRSFGANRSGGSRYHIGIDLFGRFGDSVVAIEDGRIVRFFPFCCGDNKTSWALLVQHANVVVNYGEVAPDSLSRNSLAIGSNVRAGQVIGRVGRNPGGSSMIHFETYTTGTTRSYRWMKGGTRPARLLNPTRLLLELQEQGLPRPAGSGASSPEQTLRGVPVPPSPPVIPPPPRPGVPTEINELLRRIDETLNRIHRSIPSHLRRFMPSTGIVVPTRARFLTAAEQTEARTIYGASLDFSRIVITNGLGFSGRGFTVAVSVGAVWWVAMNIGSLAPRATRPASDLLIHELAHAWQSQHHASDKTAFMQNSLINQAAAEALNAIGQPASAYAYIPGKPFREYGAEQIAEQIEDSYNGTGSPTPSIVPHVRSVAAHAADADNEASLKVFTGFERLSTRGVIPP